MSDAGYRVWLGLGDDISCDQLCTLLAGIGRLGSINRAAAELKFSYRHAWGLIKKAEGRLGEPLLAKRVGGAEGGGAELTEAATGLLRRYDQFRAEVAQRVGHIFGEERPRPGVVRPLLLASTIGPIEAGILPALEDGFCRASGMMVRHIGAGSGQALDIAREGLVDLVLAHAPDMEAAFLAAGFGAGRYPVMQNDFLLVGPGSDPAGVRGASFAVAAFGAIAAAGAPFVSRGDRSGTHAKEMALWAAASVAPAEPWYRVYDRGTAGSAPTLRFAAQSGAYTLVDRATYVMARAEGMELVPLFTGDPMLGNEFALIPVNPDRFPQVQHEAALRFVAWATGPEGQELIRGFGRDRYGEPLFFPGGRLVPPGFGHVPGV